MNAPAKNHRMEAVVSESGSGKDYYAPIEEHDEGVSEGAITVINAAEINQQIATAKRYPRFPAQFRRRVFEMATYNQDVAESCIYALPRDGKMIDGPSIRFAEILQIAWGNCRSSTEVTDIGEEFVTAEGVFFDLESNSAVKAKLLRRITGRSGKRYGPDMIATTGNAACSIALRNAILRGIPKALWYELFDEAKKVAAGTQQTFLARRDKVMKELGIQGATPDMIFALLGVTGVDDLKTEHVVHLRGLQNAIKDGETSLEEAFATTTFVKPSTPKNSEFARSKPEASAQDAQSEPTHAKTAAQAVSAAAADPVHEDPAPDESDQQDDSGGSEGQSTEEWLSDMEKIVAATTDLDELAELFNDIAGGLVSKPHIERWVNVCADRVGKIAPAALGAVTRLPALLDLKNKITPKVTASKRMSDQLEKLFAERKKKLMRTPPGQQ